jgi:hypothetical protein
LLVDNA